LPALLLLFKNLLLSKTRLQLSYDLLNLDEFCQAQAHMNDSISVSVK